MGLWAGIAGAAGYTATWTQVSASNSPGAPEWRGWSAMTWVGSQNRIVLWGGSGGAFLNDIAAFDALTTNWTTLQPNLNCPGNTSFLRPNGSDVNGLVHDPINDLLWLYNGGSGYRCPSTQLVGRIAGAGTTASSIVDPTLSGATNDFYKDWIVRDVSGAKVTVISYVAATKTLALSGAINVAPGVAYDLYVDFGDGTWSYSFATGQWAKLMSRHWGYTGYLPPSRRSAGFAADATKAILFGGVDYDNGTYKLDFATKSYSPLIPQGLTSSPAARGQIENQFVYDSAHNRFVLFGGRCFDPARCTPQTLLDDTWVYDANSNGWTQATGATHPSARNQGQMYFDSANGVVVLYGGIGSSGTPLNDLWTFDVATLTWTAQTMTAPNPGGIYLGQVAYAPSTGCGYVVYGVKAGPSTSGATWRLCLVPVGGNQPPIASFTATPSTTAIGSPIAFSAAGSSDPGGSITNYAWNFGDGTTGSGVSASKSYAAAGTYTVTLTVTDNGGLTGTTTRTVTITAANQPPVANFMATPSPTTVGTPIAFSATASSDPDGTITNYAWSFGDGTVGSGVSVSKSYAAAGTFTVTLTVTDNGGKTGTTTGTVTINAAGGGVTTVWVEDALPAGAIAGGSESFIWISANPAPYSGTKAHQSGVTSGIHQHYFVYATAKLVLGVGDKLFAYVYLDPANPPREVMLQFYDGSWEHRAYWGADLIPWGANGGTGRRYMGPLPVAGQWVRLEVSAAQVGLEGRTLDGMAFTLYDGRATWDYAGKTTSAGGNQPPVASFSATPSTTTTGSPIAFSAATSSDPDGSITSYAWSFGDGTVGSGVSVSKSYAVAGTFTVTLTVTDNGGKTGTTTGTVTINAAGGGVTTVWVEDALPAGAIAGGSESFIWISANPAPYSGTKAHQSGITSGIHQHYFVYATTKLAVGVGDKLFAYVYLDPANPPRTVMLQFYDGSWEHRAYWGADLIPWGANGGTGKRYMGSLPVAGQWVRLEVSAAQVGLEGRTLNGMAFTLYDGRATWDYTGKLGP